jgi:hypothetical protein
MKTLSLKVMTSLILACLLPAATSPIGVVVSDGHFTLNNTDTSGNVTVLEGSSVQTGNSGASIRLNSGAQVILGADSLGRLAGNRLELERGSAKLAGYSVHANRLNIDVDHVSSATVLLRGKAIEVAALTGNIHVFGASGINVANLAAGDALTLQPEDGGAASLSSLTGCVRKSGISYNLTDETSKVTVVLHGKSISAGQRVKVSGQMVDEPGSSNKGLNVQEMTVLSGGCKSHGKAAAAGAAAGGAAAGGVAGGISSGAVIAGVVVAGATAATAVAVTQTSSSSSSSSGSSLSNGR